MPGARLNFCKKVGVVRGAFGPDYVENFATRAVTYPMVAHIVGFRLAQLYSIVCNTDGSHVVGKYWGLLLRIAESCKNGTLEVSMLAVGVK